MQRVGRFLARIRIADQPFKRAPQGVEHALHVPHHRYSREAGDRLRGKHQRRLVQIGSKREAAVDGHGEQGVQRADVVQHVAVVQHLRRIQARDSIRNGSIVIKYAKGSTAYGIAVGQHLRQKAMRGKAMVS